ncbi:1-phosphofructokinase [Marinobacter sp. HL-58]|uniref:1-phosphofructokinase n=1 Tax=Marinobacter sp. HL-58 TaxID=1479237 RepID=UPI000481BAE8|nr:1-phosphofructokinase [Marinobacter sp. HL-58]KPQ02932.1 MAG: 1-phosphofructokinase FruK [Marinobacter sp. HL-58]
MPRVLTITLNPALDLNVETGTVRLGGVNRSRTTRLDAAGKGINLARVLSRLGHTVTVSGLLGDINAAPFERLFHSDMLDDQFVRVPGQNRINVKIAEDGGRVTDLNGPGFDASPESLKQLETRLGDLTGHYDAVAIAGSLPAGFEADALARLVCHFKASGTPVWLDTSGPALDAGLRALPDGIKPNIDELAEWAGSALDSLDAVAAAARALQETGIAHVVVSMGEKGVLWLSPSGDWLASPPPVTVLSTVCAGDTLLAGMIHGLLERNGDPVSCRRNCQQILSTATALSAECVRHVGVGDPMADDFTQLIEQTRVTLFTPWPGHNNNGEMPL